ncbi:hypothetical protein FHS14_003278 [Paenibacillus baekrokdamisoli]|uniref:hypothetical protein n=1 Tax=Paenibacillus baekrokdamisoli TaxID=1712516 RepID=UPI0017DE709E|nr:hypothetical protein [Paenibacillus baekrokdamisoli]MBB3070283.1 hypothetical protein [Paenibacillus baekrokdamisoli]
MPNVSAPVAQAPAWVMPVAYPAVKQMEHHEKKNWCKEHMHRYVLVKTHDGYCVDGFVEHIDDEMVCIAVPYCEAQWDRGCPCPYPPIYPYPYYPRRRFVRQAFPLAGLLAISLLPFY